MTERILVVAAHPDDEALGCAGTLLKHAAHGDRIDLVFMTNGVSSRSEAGHRAVMQRHEAAEKAAGMMHASTTYFDFPDNRMDSLALLDIVQVLEPVVRRLRPTRVYTHHIGDLNVDHRITHQAVMTACRPLPGSSVRTILTFEVQSSTEWQTPGVQPFIPNVFVDISDFIDKKRKVIDCYLDEMREAPHTRSIENVIRLNELRGNAMGIAYAEAYNCVRMVC